MRGLSLKSNIEKGYKQLMKILKREIVYLLAGLSFLIFLCGSALANNAPRDPSFPYRGTVFSGFVEQSFSLFGKEDPTDFYVWFEKACAQNGTNLIETLKGEKETLSSITDTPEKSLKERDFCAKLHRLVKQAIPKFSLDRGFEFYYTMKNGERQCFLQSVLLSGLLQEAGIPAGVVMVFRNEAGKESNNGHAVTLVHLADGHDLLLDASEPVPFARHQGLFVRMLGNPSYRYVIPVYDASDIDVIDRYKAASGNGSFSTSDVLTLDIAFLNSQFWYYRGERTHGGLVLGPKTPKGLAAAEKAFRKSLSYCPDNPLTVIMLGRDLSALGKTQEARLQFQRAYALYRQFGWIPGGLRLLIAKSAFMMPL